MTPCPLCGAPLTAITDPGPFTAPWLCEMDARGWWPAELTPTAQGAFRPGLRDYGHGTDAADLAEQVTDQQRAQAAGLPLPQVLALIPDTEDV